MLASRKIVLYLYVLYHETVGDETSSQKNKAGFVGSERSKKTDTDGKSLAVGVCVSDLFLRLSKSEKKAQTEMLIQFLRTKEAQSVHFTSVGFCSCVTILT